ncbi:MAG TPA: bifunctional 2-polyprenyl-6-hydroxyphenol methylase/3-demethylubiquinol 3-O-methyltransferase UbiG [Sphingomonadales bacterium]|nr:bifunctional 2-polyprenyl-6-hydroxyphenol methylase/3-demethylubiquinol 3-O-methyltransferase UbiG [Sphingomonadales bacterium]
MAKAGIGGSGASLDAAEVARFSALAESWWDAEGPLCPLHRMNPLRLDYIKGEIVSHFALDAKSKAPLQSLQLLDVGCGGGLLAEPMARLGAAVTGLDASEENIAIARLHAQGASLPIAYVCGTAEDLATEKEKFDVILNMEVIEHVADVKSYLTACRRLLKDDGLMIFSTLARTPKAWLLAIVGAEMVLRWLPKGTHDFTKFLKPSELAEKLNEAGFRVKDLTGFVFDPLSGRWSIKDDLSVNYADSAVPAR